MRDGNNCCTIAKLSRSFGSLSIKYLSILSLFIAIFRNDISKEQAADADRGPIIVDNNRALKNILVSGILENGRELAKCRTIKPAASS
jgi:hypothetical protein